MSYGIQYQNSDIIYVSFQKHFCPSCQTRVRTVMVQKTVERDSPEGKDFDFHIGRGVAVEKATFKWKEFECPNCNRHFTVKEMQQIEGVYAEPTEEVLGEKPKKGLRRLCRFFLFLLVLCFLAWLMSR